MIYMIAFWVLMLTSFVLHHMKKRYAWVRDGDVVVFLLGVSSLAGAILTRDPIFSSFGVPLEFEWVVGLFIAGSAAWKVYFAPLKERVVKNETGIVGVLARLKGVEEDVHLVKQKMFS